MSMHIFPKPRIFCSKCLEFAACRWNGAVIPFEMVKKLESYAEFVTNCPEVEIGLGIPRDPIRIIKENERKELYQPSSGKRFTYEMESYCQKLLDDLPEVDGYILKHRSPSCGPRDVKLYPGAEYKSPSERTTGFFAEAVLNRQDLLPIEDEGRLMNFTIRERFLIRVFMLADFRQMRSKGRMGDLVNFHSRHKYLLMAFSQKALKDLGPIVANHDKKPAEEVFNNYADKLHSAIASPNALNRRSVTNVLMHILGYFKKELNSREKAHFLDLLEQYGNKQLPLSAILSLLTGWVERIDSDYLRMQSFFRPYPLDLTDISDSGKGRDY